MKIMRDESGVAGEKRILLGPRWVFFIVLSSPLTSVIRIFGVHFSLRGMQQRVRVHQMTAAAAPANQYFAAAWEENQLFSHPDRNIEPF